ncbi:hypothetical protein D1007_17500 [Hordeum vulgare]|nr:hypothetical protein D1007_17500 [Hordeum vulgare]
MRNNCKRPTTSPIADISGTADTLGETATPAAQFRHVSSPSHPQTPSETPPTTPPPPPTMANFELDPKFFLPPGHNIIDGGPGRLPRTYTMPVVPITRRHERFVIADVHPAPPADNWVQVRQEVAALLLQRGLHVRSAHPWIEGVGLFELRDAAESYVAVQMVPQEVAHNSVIQWYLLLLMTVVGDSRQLLLMEEDGNLRRPQKHPLLILFRTRSPW